MKQFNIKNGTIKLGTLNEYKETEIEQIQDLEEGYLRFHLKFDKEVTVKSEWLNGITNGTMGFNNRSATPFAGRTHAGIENLHIVRCDNDHVTIRNTSFVVEREALNSFVFCMSKVRKTHDWIGIFPDYDDCWYMAEAHRLDFCRVLGDLLLEAIIDGYRTGNHIIPANTPLHDLTIYRAAKPVRYLPRDTHITNENIMAIDEFTDRMIHISYTKPTIFEHEAEFRFLYDIVAGGHFIQPIVNSVILDATRLQRFTFQI